MTAVGLVLSLSVLLVRVRLLLIDSRLRFLARLLVLPELVLHLRTEIAVQLAVVKVARLCLWKEQRHTKKRVLEQELEWQKGWVLHTPKWDGEREAQEGRAGPKTIENS
jgi:hypothetical protein